MTKSISVQLHCYPEELVELIQHCISDLDLYYTYSSRQSDLQSNQRLIYSIKYLSEIKIEEVQNWDEILITQYRPILGTKSPTDFLISNPNTLIVRLGVPKDKTLEESWISTRCENEDSFAVWKKIAGRVKKKLKIGGDAVNTISGARGSAKSHYYSPKALGLSLDGGKLYLLGNRTNIFVPGQKDEGKTKVT